MREKKTEIELANQPAIDRESVRELRAEAGDLLSELVDMFSEQTPLQLIALENALTTGDAGAARLCAHTLKGTAGNFGAHRMQALALSIEEKARDAALDGALEILAELRLECARVREALEAER